MTAAVLEFNEAAHVYSLGGEVLPSVTQILKEAGIVDFSYCTDFARERGSAVHRAIHYALEGDLVESSVHSVVRPYVDAALKLIADLRAETYEVERRVFSRLYGYAGTADWIGRINGRLALVDHKTGDPGDACGWQTAAYAMAYEEETGIAIEERYCFRLYNDGTYKVIQYDDPIDFDVFAAALTIAGVRRSHGFLD